ncbi:GIY-YIG nuclease family protein [Streptomyces sp. NPDC047980]|uniref:GIY-YIG nuclease family protein n=1 Tax=Streptomyces sp. NPDC047980 TaxID=3365494 RepID=UPI0037193404
MAQHGRGKHLGTSRPYTPDSVKSRGGWVGVPGARHIPASGDPVFPHFTEIVADWTQAGIEMTDELMAAALKLATSQVQRAKERRAIEARNEERRAKVVANPPPPGTYGDAPGGVVYYVRRDQYVKIGTTVRLQERMRNLMPDQVLAIEPGSYTLERQLHTRFAHLRVSQSYEYFRMGADLRAHIALVVEKVGPPPTGLTVTDFLKKTS